MKRFAVVCEQVYLVEAATEEEVKKIVLQNPHIIRMSGTGPEGDYQMQDQAGRFRIRSLQRTATKFV